MKIVGLEYEIMEHLKDRIIYLENEVRELKAQLESKKEKNFIRRRLTELDISQADIARHLGLDPSAVCYLIAGRRELKAKELIPLAEKLQVEPMELLKELGKK